MLVKGNRQLCSAGCESVPKGRNAPSGNDNNENQTEALSTICYIGGSELYTIRSGAVVDWYFSFSQKKPARLSTLEIRRYAVAAICSLNLNTETKQWDEDLREVNQR